MKLVLAEKPSVAQSIAKVLGATKREDGYLEGNGYVVSWCVGHLVELSQPEAYDEKYNKWAYADLPIFPDQWKYQVSASTKKQFGILKKLMARKDVESLVCATDAGREGELIFRLVYQQAGCRKPFERLWISSMEDSAIREGFEQLKPSTEYDALYEAALCRERADWLVGINATRLFSTLYGQTLNVGRVMTPTLAMVVMREAAISAFRPEPFYAQCCQQHRKHGCPPDEAVGQYAGRRNRLRHPRHRLQDPQRGRQPPRGYDAQASAILFQPRCQRRVPRPGGARGAGPRHCRCRQVYPCRDFRRGVFHHGTGSGMGLDWGCP